MKNNLRQLLFCAALAGILPLSLAAQAEAPTDKNQTAPAVAAPSDSSSSSASDSSVQAVPAPAAPAASTASSSEPPAAAPAEPAPAASTAVASGDQPLRRLDSTSDAGDTPAAAADDADNPDRKRRGAHVAQLHGSSDRVTFGTDAILAKDENANAVVAIGGNATNAGTVRDSVVAIGGNAHVTGPVSNAVVAVLGNVYVDSDVAEVVAVLGNVELGPNADVRREVVCVGGEIKRDPKAVVRGGSPNVHIKLGALGSVSDVVQAYVGNCLLKGRPLAIAPHLGWLWGITLGFFLLYLILALLFGGAVEKSVQTLETRPGGSILAALLTLLLTPVLILLLIVTVVGIAVVPFIAIALVCVGIFGKAVMLAWIGRRITRFFGDGPLSHPAFAVLIGGVIVLALYLVPFVGFFVYKLLGFLGTGVVVYTLLLASKREKRAPATVAAGVAPAIDPGSIGAAGFTAEGAPAVAAVAVPVAPPVALATLPRAGFWIRVGALVIDIVLVAIVTGVSSSILPAFVHVPFPSFLILLATYGAVLWKIKGTTIGGIICGLRVVRTDGRELDWPTAVVRALGCFLSLFVVGLGFIWVAIDDEKQSWHDKIAGTAVVLARGGQSLV